MQRKGSILGRGDESYGNATVKPAVNPWHLYAYGFRRAAEILMRHVDEHHTSLDVIVFPTVFLYRHHLELAIKLIARDARSILDIPQPQKAEHRLRALWDEARDLVIRVQGGEPVGLEAVDAVVAQFDALDSRSTAFRYPETFDGSNPLSHLSTINLLILKDSIEPALDMLDAAHDVLEMRMYEDVEGRMTP